MRQDDRWAPIRQAQHRCPKTHLVTIMKCEGDIFAFLQEALQQKLDLLIRAKKSQTKPLWPSIQSLPQAGDMALSVERQGERAARPHRRCRAC
jgi:hypothetical protein